MKHRHSTFEDIRLEVMKMNGYDEMQETIKAMKKRDSIHILNEGRNT